MLSKFAWGTVGVLTLGTLAYFYESWNKRSKKKYAELKQKLMPLIRHIKEGEELDGKALEQTVLLSHEEAEKDFKSKYRGLAAQRRKALKERDIDEYVDLLRETADQQKEIREDFLKYALGKLGLTVEEFELLVMTTNPPLYQVLQLNMPLVHSKEIATVPRDLTRTKARNILLSILQGAQDPQWTDIYKAIELSVNESNPQKVMMQVSPLIQILQADILKNEHNCTIEQFEAAKNKYNLQEDPMIRQLAMQMNMAAQIAGMG